MEIPMTITAVEGRVEVSTFGDRRPQFADSTVRAQSIHGDEITFIAGSDTSLRTSQPITVTITITTEET